MSFEIWIMFFLAYLLVTLSPGPNVLLVLKNSIQYGWKSAFITILGNLSCQFIIVCLVSIGVCELLKELPIWFTIMKIIGGIYLIYLGIKSFSSISKVDMPTKEKKTKLKTSNQLFSQAFLVSASNPKTMIFLSAFLPQFLDLEHSHNEQFFVMYLTICFIVIGVHLGYSLIINHIGRKVLLDEFKRKLSKITGGLFISMGGGILLSSKS